MLRRSKTVAASASAFPVVFAIFVASSLAPASSFSFAPSSRRQSRQRSPVDVPICSSRCRVSFPDRNIAENRSPWLLGGAALDEAAASSSPTGVESAERLEALAQSCNDAIKVHGSEVFRTFNAEVGVVPPSDDDDDDDFQQKYLRLGLFATETLKDDQLVASLPFNDDDGSGLAMAPRLAAKVAFKDVLPDGYDGWTGDIGLLAMLLLNEFARANVDANGGPKGTGLPRRKSEGTAALMSAWISSLPSPREMEVLHPLMWDEDDQERLQSSSTKKIYRLLDDVDDDSSWLDENVWGKDRDTFPETVAVNVGDGEEEERPCFSPDGFRYAVSLVRSRSYFVEGSLRLLPYLDMANHDDYESQEIAGGAIGTLWGSAKGALLKSGRRGRKGDEVRVSYGPKGPADYLLDHGFVPPMCRLDGAGAAVTAELAFEVDDADRFRDDKLDVLEYETYDLAPMDPSQAFDVAGGPGSTGEPDPAAMQFLRLAKLGGKDAFLLESIFRKEVWGFMSEPVSEDNERAAVEALAGACERALAEMDEVEEDDDGGRGTEGETLCGIVRASERDALGRALDHARREAQALDLKEYYQERRLKSLGLDSEWSMEDEMGYGATRVPGGADYDW